MKKITKRKYRKVEYPEFKKVSLYMAWLSHEPSEKEMDDIVNEQMDFIKKYNCPEICFEWEETKYNWFEKLIRKFKNV